MADELTTMTTPAGEPDAAGTAGAAKAVPVLAAERVESLDVLRGFALLGILVPNIVVFAWPSAAMADSSVIGPGFWNGLAGDITATVFHGKFMFLFSMLFGAGVVFFDRKSRGRGGKVLAANCRGCGRELRGLPADPSGVRVCPACGRENGPAEAKPRLTDGAGLWFRRTAWLLVIGVMHAVLLWFGDILVWYAVNGMLAVWWMRRLNPRLQIGLGVALHALSTLLLVGLSFFGVMEVAGGDMEPNQMMGDPATELAAYTGSYADAISHRVIMLLFFWFLYGPLFVPAVTGMMLMGIGLTRLGVLTGERGRGLYAWMALVGIGGGFPLTLGLFLLMRRVVPAGMGDFIWQAMGQFVGIPLGLGYAGLLILLLKSGLLKPVLKGLAAVGRMALTNYLLQTILCTTFFYGYGFGYFGEIEYPGLWGVIAAVWAVNIVLSVLWLRAFRFGPAEWAWRSLTYWKLQALRKRPAGA